MMLELLKELHKEFKVLKGAPWVCLLLILITGSVVYGITSWHYSEHISFLNDQIVEYREKLHGASPVEASKRVDDLLNQLKTAEDKIFKLTAPRPDRHLSDMQKEKLKLELKAIAPQLGDEGFGAMAFTEPEPRQYMKEISAVFEKASIKVYPTMEGFADSTDKSEIEGFFIEVKDKNAPPEKAVLLMKAFTNAGINVSFQNMEGMGEGGIAFFAGYAPSD